MSSVLASAAGDGKVPYARRHGGDATCFLMSEPIANWLQEASQNDSDDK